MPESRVFLLAQACVSPITTNMNVNRFPPALAFLFAITFLVAPPSRADDADIASAAYKQSYIDNDFSYLDDPKYQGHFLGERLKRLRPCRNVTIDLGGRFRSRFHNENNLRGGRRLTGASDEYALSQTFLFGDIQIGDCLRIFGQAIDATSDGERRPSRLSEVNRFDMQMLAVDALLLTGGDDQEWWLRCGRQEMHYGSQRLVASRPWRNTPLTHDGLRTWWKADTARIDAFWVRPIDPRQHRPDDHNFDNPDQSRQFYGVFGTSKAKTATYDLYYLGMTEADDRVRTFAGVPGGFDVHTIGGRVLRREGDLRFEFEGGYQFGSFSTSRQSAAFATIGMGHTFERLPFKPTTWLYYDWASGDGDLNDNVHGTFYQLEPRGHYYLGLADLTGRQNIQDLSLQTSLAVRDGLECRIHFHNFWLANRRDALYTNGTAPAYHDPSGAAGNEIGHELDLQLRWSISPRAHLLVGYSYLWAGDYFDSPVIQGGPAGIAINGASGDDGEFTYVQSTLRF